MFRYFIWQFVGEVGTLAGMPSRLLAPPDQASAVYHCVSRIVDRRFIFDAPAKEHFVQLLREAEEFCEVRVLTYCLMSNHFHVLVEVPRPPEPPLRPTPDQVLAKLAKLSGHQNVGLVRQRFAMYREARDEVGLAQYLATFHARMWDLSQFVKLLKQRFTLWYNLRMGREGTLWENRFRSVLVEGQGQALATMAAYIDLNPVRAGLVRDPKEYRWSGYGEAVAGKRRAKEGIQRLVTALQRGREETAGKSLEVYRMWVYREGDERRAGIGEDGRALRGSMSGEAVAEVLKGNGKLPLAEYLRCRVRYFTAGAVFGSREYVEGVFGAYRERFGKKRRSGARRVRGLAGGEAYVLRDLRKSVFGSS